MGGNIGESIVYSGKTITASSGAIQSIRTIIGTTDDDKIVAARRSVRWVEIRAHSASFYFGTAAHAAKDTQPAYEPYFRYGTQKMLDDTYIRAVADAAITNVVIEVGFAGPV